MMRARGYGMIAHHLPVFENMVDTPRVRYEQN